MGSDDDILNLHYISVLGDRTTQTTSCKAFLFPFQVLKYISLACGGAADVRQELISEESLFRLFFTNYTVASLRRVNSPNIWFSFGKRNRYQVLLW